MTIREYVKLDTSHIKEYDEVMNPDEKNDIYWKGRTDEAKDILKELPYLEHDLTFREVIESCDIDNCPECLIKEWCLTVENSWFGAKSPCRINVDEIERKYSIRMKERKNG